MATIQVTEQNFEATVKQGIVVIDFWASWCGPCRVFGPVFDAAAERHLDVTFGKVETDAEPGLAAAFGIRSIPSLMVIRDRVLLATLPGALPAASLDALIEKVRAIDMHEVHRELDAHAEKPSHAASGGGF